MIPRIRFNHPTLVGQELAYLREALERGHLSGNGPFSQRCEKLISAMVGGGRALLTHSCTAALEMAAILAEIGPGDEVIMPSFTFTSTANAFVLRHAMPVFVDIRPDTLNLDEALIEKAITPKTKAICVVHYAGIACDMDAILRIARQYGLKVIEDAAQALHSTWRGRPLGSFGHFAALSFHETKNVISGEGGALIVNDEAAMTRAEIIWEKGTNRASFYRGEVSKYTWVDVGSSFLPGELTAAFLLAQLEKSEETTRDRVVAWLTYHEAFAPLEVADKLRRPVVPEGAGLNGHIYFLLLPDAERRDHLIRHLAACEIGSVIHYIPLHSAPAGLRFGRTPAPMPFTDDLSSRLVRLPMHPGLDHPQQRAVIEAVTAAVG